MKTHFLEHQRDLEKRYIHKESLTRSERLRLGAFSLGRALTESDIMTRSSALSYTVAFSLVPLIATSVAFLTAFPGLQSKRAHFMNLLSQQLLPNAVQSVEGYLGQFADRAAAAGAVSSLVFFVLVLVLFQTIEASFNNIWRVKKARTWGERLQTLAVFLISGAIAASLFVVVQSEAAAVIQRISGLDVLGTGTWLAQASVFLTNLLVAWALFSVANRVLPNAKVKWGPALLSGAIVGTLWLFLKSGFTWYIDKFANYKSIYGALGAIPILFLWIYLSFLLLLAGGYMAFIAQNLRTLLLERRESPTGFPRAFYAVAAAGVLARAFQRQEAPLSAEQIAERLQTPAYFVSNALSALQSAGLVLGGCEGGEDRFLLARPSELISLHEIVHHVGGDPLQIPGEEPSNSELYRKVEVLFEKNHRRLADLLGEVSISEVADESVKREKPAA